MRLLFFEMKDVCYNSYTYFAEALASMFEKNGAVCEFFKIDEKGFDALEDLVGEKYDAMIDFNSDLPRAVLDDGSYFLDHIDAPFFDFLLDHPLYHHDSIKNSLKNFHIVCLDEFHREYVLKYYPHIKSVTVCPLTGEKAATADADLFKNFDERPMDLVFTGTYTAPERIDVAISKIPKFLQENVRDLIEIQRADQSLSIEQAVDILAKRNDCDYILENFALHTQSFYLADAYLRAENRMKVIKALDNEDINFHIFGGLWEELNLKHTRVHQEVPFSLSFTNLSHAKIVLNVMPNFKAGGHDRIYSSQLNGALCLTDSSKLIDEEYTDGEDILLYDINNPLSAYEKAKEILANPEKLKKIAQAGERKVLSIHTWTNVYKIIMQAIQNA